MSDQPPSSHQAQAQAQIQSRREADYQRFKTYAAYTFLIASPILIALPPRKLDHLTILNVSAIAISTNHLTRHHTGQSLLERLESRVSSSSTQNPQPAYLSGLPSERAQEVQAKLRAAREAQMKSAEEGSEEMERLRARREQERNDEMGVARRVWMGGEEEGWKERRMREEQRALDEGRGYGDLIKEHIWDVWTWGGNNGGNEGKEDKGDKK